MRLFIAINFPKEIKTELKRYQKDLKVNGLTGRFTPEENFHLTLAFIGEYNNPDDVMDALEEIDYEPFDLRMSGTGCFGDLYWVGIENRPELANLVKRIRRSLSENDIPFDRKKFSPHITIVRRGELLNRDAIEQTRPVNGVIPVTGVSLMRSDRGKNGMIYTEIGRIE